MEGGGGREEPLANPSIILLYSVISKARSTRNEQAGKRVQHIAVLKTTLGLILAQVTPRHREGFSLCKDTEN